MNCTKGINIPIFNNTLTVIFGDKEYVRTTLGDFYEIDEKNLDEYVNRLVRKNTKGCMCYFKDYNMHVLWMPKEPVTIGEYATLVHELQHFVFMFLDMMGVTHSNDSDEIYSYLLGYMFAETDVFINDIKEGNENKQQ